MRLWYVYLSHYQRHVGQLLGLLLILACAAMLWSGIESLTGRGAAAIQAALQAQSPRLSIQRLDGAGLAAGDFARLRRAGFCVTPQLHLSIEQDQALDARAGGGQVALRLLGIDPLTADCLVPEPGVASMLKVAREHIMQQAAGDAAGFWGNAATLKRWGQYAPLAGYPLHEQAQLPASLLLGDIATLAEFAARKGSAPRLELLMPAPLPKLLPVDYEGVLQDYGVSSAPLARSFLLSLDALGWLGLLVATLLVRAVYLFAMEQRRCSLNILFRYGVPRWQLRLCLLMELLLLCMLGGALGVWLGQALAGLLSDGFRGTLTGLFGIEGLGDRRATGPLWLQAALVLLVLLGWACSDIFLLRDAQRSKGEPHGKSLWSWVVAVLLIQAGALALALSTALWQVFVATGACLLGGGMLLPRLLGLLLGGLLYLVQRGAGRPLLEWSCSELQAMCRLLRLPLLALAFAIASAIGIQAMVAGFESTFARWLDQRLQGELYLDPGQGVLLQEWLEPLQALPQVRRVQPRVRAQALVEQQAVDVLGVDPEAEQAQGWGFLASMSNPWQALQGQGVLVNEQLARRQQLKLGDWLKVRLGTLEKLYQVAAIYADYGRPSGEILLALKYLPQTLPGRHTTFVLGLAPGAAPDWQRWTQQYAWLEGSRLRDQATLKAGARSVFARTFRITGALSGLTLLLSGVALALMAHALLRLRAPSYTWLHVCGLTRAQLRIRLCVHAMLLTTVLAVLATPLGVFLTWVLVARVNPIAFGWALPLHLYPLYWLQVWLLCLLVGATTGILMANPVRLETLKND